MELIGKNLSMNTCGRNIFADVNVTVPSGLTVAIIGPSGSGKTTLLNCLGLIQQPTSGEVLVDGQVITTNNHRAIRSFWKNNAAFIYQDSGIIEEESIFFNVTLNRRSLRKRCLYDKTALSALAAVGLEGRGKEQAAVLSGGEKQRLGLARAIYKKASIIFADEPTASLDAKNRNLVWSLLQRQASLGTSIVLATHDMRLASSCDMVLDLAEQKAKAKRPQPRHYAANQVIVNP